MVSKRVQVGPVDCCAMLFPYLGRNHSISLSQPYNLKIKVFLARFAN